MYTMCICSECVCRKGVWVGMCPCSNSSTAAGSARGVSSGVVCVIVVQYRCYARMGMASRSAEESESSPATCHFLQILAVTYADSVGHFWLLLQVTSCCKWSRVCRVYVAGASLGAAVTLPAVNFPRTALPRGCVAVYISCHSMLLYPAVLLPCMGFAFK